jgi:hypothetical protein
MSSFVLKYPSPPKKSDLPLMIAKNCYELFFFPISRKINFIFLLNFFNVPDIYHQCCGSTFALNESRSGQISQRWSTFSSENDIAGNLLKMGFKPQQCLSHPPFMNLLYLEFTNTIYRILPSLQRSSQNLVYTKVFRTAPQQICFKRFTHLS